MSQHKNKHIEKSVFQIALNLCMIAFFAGIILATANFFTTPLRKANEVKAKEDAKKDLLHDAVKFESHIDAITKGVVFPEVLPNEKLRKILNKKSESTLLNILKKIDHRRAEKIDVKKLT